MSSQLYFVLERFRRRFAEILVALRPLSVAPERPRTHAARLLFREQTGVALLELSYTTPLKRLELEWTMNRARRAGIPVLDPDRLAESDRDRFFTAYLDGYETVTEDFPAAEPALLALGSELGLNSAPPLRRTAGGSTAGDILLARSIHPGTAERPSGFKPRAQRVPAIAHDSPSERAPTMNMGSPMQTLRATPPGGERAIQSSKSGDLLEVRFLRGDQWTHGRVRALNSKGCFVATGAPPRLRDLVHIALRFRELHVVVRGAVTRVASPSDPASVGFRAAFIHLDEAPRRQLVSLLRAAHAAGLSLKPPPERSAVRFPVHWPIRLSTGRGHVTAPALDVSSSGLFLEVAETLTGELRFLFPLDNGESPIRGRAEVARQVDPSMAARRGLASGYGVRILEFSAEDQRRYEAFLTRVRQRATHRVVVAASPERSATLHRSLSAVGYAVSAGSDPGVLLQRWELEPRPPDVAIFDGSLDPHSAGAAHLRRRWTERGVSCVTTGRDHPEQIRRGVDRLLRIGTGDAAS